MSKIVRHRKHHRRRHSSIRSINKRISAAPRYRKRKRKKHPLADADKFLISSLTGAVVGGAVYLGGKFLQSKLANKSLAMLSTLAAGISIAFVSKGKNEYIAIGALGGAGASIADSIGKQYLGLSDSNNAASVQYVNPSSLTMLQITDSNGNNLLWDRSDNVIYKRDSSGQYIPLSASEMASVQNLVESNY